MQLLLLCLTDIHPQCIVQDYPGLKPACSLIRCHSSMTTILFSSTHQTAAVVKTTNRMLAIIRISFAVLNIVTLPLLFKALFRSLLEYRNVIGGPHNKMVYRPLKRLKGEPQQLLTRVY